MTGPTSNFGRDLLPGDDLHSRARWLLTQLDDGKHAELRAQARVCGIPLLDMCAHFLARCEAGER